jgi:hypothetical protein
MRVRKKIKKSVPEYKWENDKKERHILEKDYEPKEKRGNNKNTSTDSKSE